MLNFMGIGAQKCGTSWLHNALAKHPGISFPAGKEIHYWNRPGRRSLADYKALFADSSYINGDFTPAYAFLPTVTIRQIHSTFPDLRLIYLIRNPKERAWSSARMALEVSEMLHHEASDQWFIDHFQSIGSLLRGDYESCIRQWRSVYRHEQLLLIRYESIVNDPIGVLKKCLNHLGLEYLFKEQEENQLLQPVFKGDGVSIRPQLQQVLSQIYSDRISSLSHYLGEDFSSWND
jgi:hypothetical protein